VDSEHDALELGRTGSGKRVKVGSLFGLLTCCIGGWVGGLVIGRLGGFVVGLLGGSFNGRSAYEHPVAPGGVSWPPIRAARNAGRDVPLDTRTARMNPVRTLGAEV
jgi:hypothetical protein